jgi:GMP synthase-like glutamine amidotransferase
LSDYLDARGIEWQLVAIDQGEAVPQRFDDVAGLVFLGGTMSVNDDHPWLAEQMQRCFRMEGSPLPPRGRGHAPSIPDGAKSQ